MEQDILKELERLKAVQLQSDCKWSPEEEDILRKAYKKGLSVSALVTSWEGLTGTKRTHGALDGKLTRMGLRT